MKSRACVVLISLALALPSAPVIAGEIEGIGSDMGYRLFGEAKKNRPVLLQNSRPHPVEYFDTGRGRFVEIPAYSEAEVACRGKSRKLNVRYRDAFRETNPFQLQVECGREVQFIAPQQVAPPRPVELAPPAARPAIAPDIVVDPATPVVPGVTVTPAEAAGGQ